MRAGKIIHQHRHGKGRTSVHRLTPARPGPIGDTGMRSAADMYVDPSPFVSLKGIDPDRMRDPRGNVMRAHDESHIQSRTRGRARGSSTLVSADEKGL